MPIRKLMLAAALVGLLALPERPGAQSPDDARLTSARELMAVAGVAKQFDGLMPLLVERLVESYVAVAPEKADEIREVFGQIIAKFIDRKAQLIDQIAGLYAEKLSREELDAILGFYKSPAGLRFVAVQPEIARAALILGQRWGAEIGGEVEAEARRELKKRGIDL